MHQPTAVLFVALIVFSFATPVLAESANLEFAACVNELKTQARAEGIGESVVNQVLDQVRPVERVIELDREQPEFTRTFADYYGRRVTENRVMQGRALLAQHRDLLLRVQELYGVPPHYLLAFWGLETNFGSYFGNMPVPNSLATLACDERRGAFFASELMAALRIIEQNEIEPADMLGSWAGAMGNFQFLPSVYLRHAIDADGDGRRDLWKSLPDAVTSAANFLTDLGWQRGYRWGREARLPDDFDYALTGRDQRRPLADWAAMGVTDAYGRALPSLDVPTAVIVPSGGEGPAFLAYPNFDIIMRWNRSEFYALAVGRLADRIAGAGELTRAPADAELKLSFEDVRALQTSLSSLGYLDDEADGLFGPNTRRALSTFQRDRALRADGFPSGKALRAVREASQSL
jgi:membrane-bound lytic murein transglycosylase B